jgi:hypothetical protein
LTLISLFTNWELKGSGLKGSGHSAQNVLDACIGDLHQLTIELG